MTRTHSRSSRVKARNLAFCLGLAVLCALALIKAGRWTLAEHYRIQASETIQGWQESQQASLESWNQVYETVGKAIALNEAHSALHYLRGYLHEWRITLPYAVDESLSPEAQQQAMIGRAFTDLLSARTAYREALALAPSLPDTWARLAITKLRLGMYDAEFSAAYGNTYRYGRNLNGMHLPLTTLSLGFYSQISADPNLAPLQAAHFEKVLGGSNATPHLEMMKNRGLLPDICMRARDAGWELSAASSRACVQLLGPGGTP